MECSSGTAALINTIINSRNNRRNTKAVTALETGKLDLSVATYGHDLLMDLIRTLRTEVRDCHAERDEFRTMLEEHDLLHKSGT